MDTAELELLFDELRPLLASIGIDTRRPDPKPLATQVAEAEALVARLGLQLHPHVRWWWENWPDAAAEIIHPSFALPDIAVGTMQGTDFDFRLLMPVGYGHHQYLLVDLTCDRAGDAYLYVYDMFGDTGARLVFSGFTDLLRYILTFFDEIAPCAAEGSRFDLVHQRTHLGTLLPIHVPEADKAVVTRDVSTWPDRWRHHFGIPDDAAALRGRTHTVAELVDARAAGPVEGTLVGRVKNIGGGGQGTVARLTDETGSLQLLILPDALWFGRSPSDTYELDVVADALIIPELTMDDYREVQRAALEGRMADAARAALGIGHHLTGAHPVRATAQRRVDWTGHSKG